MLAQRYFRADAATYEAMRLGLDAAWGFPNAGTRSCYRPASDGYVPQDGAGRLYLAVHSEWCEWDAVVVALPGLLASGAVEEVTREDYMAALPVGP